MKIYVGQLDYDTSDDELNDLFATYGKVTSASIVKDKYTGDSKGFGFVEMERQDEGETAIKNLKDSKFKGRNIRVNIARPKKNPSF